MKALKDYTLKELVSEIASTGSLNTDIESICIYQDIIGHTSVDEVKEISNAEMREAFYRLYGVAYGTIEAIKYYVSNSEHVQGQFNDLQDKIDDLEGACENYKRAYEKEAAITSADRDIMKTLRAEKEQKREELAELKLENLKLKAKLYDMMTA